MTVEYWRPLINVLLTVLYSVGLFFAWTGFKLLARHRGDPIAAMIGISLGILIWSVLSVVCRLLSSSPNPATRGSSRVGDA